jgi:hyperosmotically inducible protein
MTTKQNFGKLSRLAPTFGTSALAVALLVGAGLAQAATDTPANPASAAAKKTERVVSDSWITTKVKSEILANSVSKAFKVSVKTKSGMVSLGGKLPSQDSIDLVKMIAEKVDGVKSVDVSGLSTGM